MKKEKFLVESRGGEGIEIGGGIGSNACIANC